MAIALKIVGQVAAHGRPFHRRPARLHRRSTRATWTVFSSIPRARSENQNSSPLWNSSEAKIATSTVGTAAITENKATSRVCSRPLPSPPAARAVHRHLAREQHHQRDRGDEVGDQQQRDQRRRQQGSGLGAPAQHPAAEGGDGQQEGAAAERRITIKSAARPLSRQPVSPLS